MLSPRVIRENDGYVSGRRELVTPDRDGLAVAAAPLADDVLAKRVNGHLILVHLLHLTSLPRVL